MIPKECKRLAEVDFPIAVVSAHAAREKSIRHGHPSTLHLWWARRPLASCRAMLMALLLPDPADEECPRDFRDAALKLLLPWAGQLKGVDVHQLPPQPDTQRDRPKTGSEILRGEILRFIGEFANWDNASSRSYLEIGRGLVKAAHPEETPLVVDPFAGGGSIPLEALRLGCDAFASDLNPVACLINKVLLEDIPRHGPELADELRKVGAEVKVAAEKELAEFYPTDPDGARPIAYLWARTVRCETPNCGAEIPLVRSLWLCKRANRRRAFKPMIFRVKSDVPRIEFDLFEPRSEGDVAGGTISRAKATCLCCNMVLGPDRVRAQLFDQRGGADVVFDSEGKRVGGARLLAVVRLKDDELGRHYRLPTDRDYRAVWNAQQRLIQIEGEKRADGLNLIPDEPTPVGGGSGAGRAFSVQKYGMMRWGDLFTARQKDALLSFQKLGSEHKSLQTKELLALNLGRCADYASSLCSWKTTTEKLNHTFGRQALPIIWDFTEVNLTSDMAGNESWLVRIAEREGACLTHKGQVQIADAMASSLPSESCAIWFTDPPYYDAIPYSDLSDFFLVWLKRSLPGHPLLHDPFDPANPLSPKLQEAVQDETKKVNGRPKDRQFFEDAMAKAFAEGRRVLREDGIGSVVFAHKSTEGWEALLSGMIRGGWTITGSWPISTEMAARLRARDSAALATSVHLVCRPRAENAPVGDWGEVLRELPRRVHDWMDRLQEEGVRGADLVFACIGPALEIYSRYSKVVDAEDREISLGGDPAARDPHRRGYLAYVWETVGRTALEKVLGTAESKARNGGAGALEEDARLTALFLWTIQATAIETSTEAEEDTDEAEPDDDEDSPQASSKGFSLVYDVARRFAQPLGIHLDAWEGRIIETKKGVVRLLPVSERARLLFGPDGASAVADRIESRPDRSGSLQLTLWPVDEAPKIKGRKSGRAAAGADAPDPRLQAQRTATTLDRVHAAMLLQASGRTNALRAMLKDETDRGPDFLRLANALSALYPPGCEEKRLLDAMLLAVPR
jgi:putative DNA methylase